jgi:hypothetical protein
MTLKPIFALFVSVTLCTIFAAKLSAQTVAIGHVFAEVVEPIHTTSMAITSFNLTNGIVNTESAIKGATPLNPGTVNLGVVTIYSGKSVACNLVIQSAKLSDTKGNSLMIDTTMKIKGQSDPGQVDGFQTIQINGTAHISSRQVSGLYKGTYTMVFAYN